MYIYLYKYVYLKIIIYFDKYVYLNIYLKYI